MKRLRWPVLFFSFSSSSPSPKGNEVACGAARPIFDTIRGRWRTSSKGGGSGEGRFRSPELKKKKREEKEEKILGGHR